MKNRLQTWRRALILLSVLGMIVSAYLIFQHYRAPGQSFCNIGRYVNCDIVNKSVYSEIFGISIAALGLLAYAALFVCAFKRFIKMGLAIAAAGVLFSLYLTYVELFLLNAVCIFCVTQQILIVLILLIFFFIWRKKAFS